MNFEFLRQRDKNPNATLKRVAPSTQESAEIVPDWRRVAMPFRQLRSPVLGPEPQLLPIIHFKNPTYIKCLPPDKGKNPSDQTVVA